MGTTTRQPHRSGPARRSRSMLDPLWLLNHLANPVVRLVLRSPFHGLLSSAVMLLTYHGRRSGRSYTMPVQYARDGHAIYVLPGWPARKTWWRNLRGGAPVELRVRGRVVAGTAEVLAGRDDAAALAIGLTRFLQRFPRAARASQVHISADGDPNPAEVQAAAAASVMVRISVSAPSGCPTAARHTAPQRQQDLPDRRATTGTPSYLCRQSASISAARRHGEVIRCLRAQPCSKSTPSG